MTTKATTGRLSRLDGLRAVAVVCVLVFHVSYFLVPSIGGHVLAGGFLGVDLFFVLSGFLMTTILTRDPSFSGAGPSRASGAVAFYLRRAARILPALYLLLVGQIIYTAAVGDSMRDILRPIVPMAVGVGNWNQSFGVAVPFSIAQTWSLGVEMQFYVVWPAVIWMALRRGWFSLRLACAVGIAGSAIVTAALVAAGASPSTVYGQTWSRLGEFLVGGVVALVWASGWRPGRWFAFVTAAAAAEVVTVLIVAHPLDRWLYNGGFTLTAACFGVLMLSCLYGARWSRPLDWAPFQVVGRLSYSIYLWHPFVIFVMLREFPGSVPARVVVGAAALAAVTTASTLLVEEPLRRVVSRYLSRRAPLRLPAVRAA